MESCLSVSSEDILYLRQLVRRRFVYEKISVEDITIEDGKAFYSFASKSGFSPFDLFQILREEKQISKDVFKKLRDCLLG